MNLLRSAIILFIILKSEHAFEISSSYDKVWSYINVTCAKLQKYNKQKFKPTNLRDVYYDFDKSPSRSIRSIYSNQTKISKQLELLDKPPLNSVFHGESNIKWKNDDKDIDNSVPIQENTLYGSERVLLYTNCNNIILKSGAVSDGVNTLFINSVASIILNQGWFGSNLTVLKIYAENVDFPNNCSFWLPPAINQLYIAGASISSEDLSLCESHLNMLSIVKANLNDTNFCFKSLVNLDLSLNNLKSIELREECGNNINELKISHNNIENWSSCKFPNLIYLSLDHNFITKIDLSKCSYNKLFSLDVSHNRLDEFPSFLPERLATLILSFNKIENITTIESSFKILDVSHNIIRRLIKGAFRFAWDLTELNLSHNLLSVIHGHDLSGLRQLNVLDLSHNKIEHVRPNAFSTLINLKVLHLNGNSLRKLDTRLLSSLPRQIKFLVNGNPWDCSCYLIAELSKLSRSSCLPDCYKENKLKCKQGRVWLLASTILQKCLKAIQSNLEAEYTPTPESDEDTSEENKKISTITPHSGLIVIVLLIIAAFVAKMYTERKWIKRRFCNCLEPYSEQYVKNVNGVTSIGTNSMQESESETEF